MNTLSFETLRFKRYYDTKSIKLDMMIKIFDNQFLDGYETEIDENSVSYNVLYILLNFHQPRFMLIDIYDGSNKPFEKTFKFINEDKKGKDFIFGLKKFLNNEISLNLPNINELHNKKFKDLEPYLQRKFDWLTFETICYKESDLDEFVLNSIKLNLNNL